MIRELNPLEAWARLTGPVTVSGGRIWRLDGGVLVLERGDVFAPISQLRARQLGAML